MDEIESRRRPARGTRSRRRYGTWNFASTLLIAALVGWNAPATVVAQMPADKSLESVLIFSDVSIMSGLSLPSVIGEVSASGLPNGTRLAAKGLPKTVKILPAAMRADGAMLVLPIAASEAAAAGSHDIEFVLTRGKERKEVKLKLHIEAFDTAGALKRSLAIRPLAGQPTKLTAGRPFSFEVELLNQNAQSLSVPPGSIPGMPHPAALVYRWIERLDGDQTITIAPELRIFPSGRFYGGGPSNLYGMPQLPPGKIKAVSFSPQVIAGLPRGRYRILFELHDWDARNPEPGKIPAGAKSVSFPLEIVAP